MKKACFAVCLLAIVSAASAQSPFGRLDKQKEIELGRAAYDDLLYFGKISKNQAAIQRIDRIFDTLVAALPEKEYPYQVVVVAEETVNAFCLPGGYIAVYEGLLARVPDDDALAFVLAHEIGHAAQRHWVRQSRKSQGDILLGSVFGDLLGTVYASLSRLSHTRQHESEADRFAVDLYMRAGYDAKDAAESMRLIARLDDKKKSKLPPYLHSHPNPHTRVEAIEERVQSQIKEGVKPQELPAIADLESKLYGKLPDVTITTNPWFPILQGAEWEYSIEGPGASTYRIRCLSATASDKGLIGRFEQILPNRTLPFQAFTSSDAVWKRFRPELPESAWQTELVFPSESEQEITSGSWSYRYLGTDSIETPAGKFDHCLKLSAVNRDRELVLWVAKGIGLVRRLNEKAGIDEKLVRFSRPQ